MSDRVVMPQRKDTLVASASVLALGAYFQNLPQRLHLALAVDEAMPGAPRQSTDGGLMVSSSAAAVLLHNPQGSSSCKEPTSPKSASKNEIIVVASCQVTVSKKNSACFSVAPMMAHKAIPHDCSP
jgi:hypothetical protein